MTKGKKAGDGPLVLIVDDEPSILELVDECLQDQNVRTRKAGTIEEAIRLARKEAFDLVILDINLPDGNGLDLASSIKSLDPKLPVIIITGQPDNGEIGRSLDMNIDAFLTKPVEVGKLQRIVEEFLKLRGLHKRRSGKKVLVVDDNEAMLELMKEYLDVLGAEAILTSDPKKVLALARREKPDIIFMDIVMPATWGSDLAGQLMEDPETSDIPVIFLTALADARDTEKMPKGGYRFLSKELPPDKFQEKLKDLIS